MRGVAMRGAIWRSAFLLVAIASALLGGLAGYSVRALSAVSLSRSQSAPAQTDETAQVTTPQQALAVAFRSLSEYKFTLYKHYRIEIIRRKDAMGWAVRAVMLPESPGADVSVFIKNDGSTTISPGF